MITLDGRLERITYKNSENHYTIARFFPENSYKAITIIGYLPGVVPEQSLKLKGKWKIHAKYGQQFAVESFEEALPADIVGIRKYLSSGMLKGIGATLAERIINQFGTETFTIIEEHPEQLKKVEGIGQAKVELITEIWKTHHVMRNLMSLLQSNGLKASYASKILKVYGDQAIDIINRDPFQIALDIPDIGFLIADRIAQSQGFDKDDDNRIRACIFFLLQQSANEGHIYTDASFLSEHAHKQFGIEPDLFNDMLQFLIDSREIVIEENLFADTPKAVYLKTLYQAETGLAQRIQAFLALPEHHAPLEKEAILETVVQKLSIQLSTEQLAILEEVITNRVTIITGGPGTGKTTLIRSINAIYEALGLKTALTAPTGRAARQLAGVTRRRAHTIHRLLGYNWRETCFEKNQDEPIDADAVIVDETSMVDINLMYHLLQAVPITSDLIIVGDVFQLPSVGPGNVLADIIEADIIPVFHLSHIFRQAEESQIVINAHAVRNGTLPDFYEETRIEQIMEEKDQPNHLLPCLFGENPQAKEFHFIPQANPQKVAKIVLQLCKSNLQTDFQLDPIRDVQVITPMHKGDAGTINLNQTLQNALNPDSRPSKSSFGRFRTGDKVMHLVNNYQKEVFNGDIGIIRTIETGSNTVVVDYEGRRVIYDFNELDELSLAYAISIHKSQGSEYPAVVIPLLTQHYPLLQRNLLYTAITRAKTFVFLIGNPKAVRIAINNNNPRFRRTGLAWRLRQYL